MSELATFLSDEQNTIFHAAWGDDHACTMRELKDLSRSMPMTRAREVILYTQPDCHLCELAAQMLEQSAVNWYGVDIESDLELMRKYGSHIPVLYRPDVDRELYWPFCAETVTAFIEDEI